MELIPDREEAGSNADTDAPVDNGTRTLTAQITVYVEGLTAETGLRPDHLIPFVQRLVGRSLAGYPNVLHIEWKPDYRMFVRGVADLRMEGELDDSCDPPEPFVYTLGNAVATLNRLIDESRILLVP